jgi:hypothetical protein
MPKKRADLAPDYVRITGLVPNEVAVQIDEARARLRGQGVRTSASALIEIALLELLGRRDLAEVLHRRGATVRRRSPRPK